MFIMISRTQSRWIVSLSLALGLAVAACGDSGGGATSSSAASGSNKPADSGKTAANDKSAKPADSAKPATSADQKTASADVDVDDILDSKSTEGEASGALKVDLSGVKDDAPALGGAEPPAPTKPDLKIEWLPMGSYQMPSMGMEVKQLNPEVVMLHPKGEKEGGILVTTWKDPADAGKKVEEIVKAMDLKEFKWKDKPKPYKLGPDKIPAMIGGGHAVGKDGKAGELGYVLMKGEPNILAIIGVPDGAPKEEKSQIFGAIMFMKLKK
jgi:hypothetical protein